VTVLAFESLSARCDWADPKQPLSIAYHDEEWGVPERESGALWEKLVLDGFQAGLSWITILKKREDFRRAFAGFDPDRVARFGAADRSRLLADVTIVRSAAKIDAAIAGARIFLEMRERGEDFAEFLWAFCGGKPIQNGWRSRSDIPSQSAQGVEMSKALKSRGFKFCGPVIVYAFMQAVGMVNDHLITCPRYREVAAMADA
jgi:DNA-3-methyladenine glycosylase I